MDDKKQDALIDLILSKGILAEDTNDGVPDVHDVSAYFKWKKEQENNQSFFGLLLFGPLSAPMADTMKAMTVLGASGAKCCDFMSLGQNWPWALLEFPAEKAHPLGWPTQAFGQWVAEIQRAIPEDSPLGGLLCLKSGPPTEKRLAESLASLMAQSPNMPPGRISILREEIPLFNQMDITIWPNHAGSLPHLLRQYRDDILTLTTGDITTLYPKVEPWMGHLKMDVQIHRMARSAQLTQSLELSPNTLYEGDLFHIELQADRPLNLHLLLQNHDQLEWVDSREYDPQDATSHHFRVAFNERPGLERPMLLASLKPIPALESILEGVNEVEAQSWSWRLDALLDRLSPTPVALLYDKAYRHKALPFPVDADGYEAARNAEDQGLLDEATTLYQRLLSHPELVIYRPTLRVRLANILRRQRQWDAALKEAQLAWDEAESFEDLSALGSAARVMGRIHLSQRKMDEAWAKLSQALELHTQAHDIFGQMEDHLNLAIAHWSVTQLEQAIFHYGQILAPARQTRSWRLFAMANQGMGQASHDLGRLNQARLHYEEAHHSFARILDERGQAAVLGDLGLLALWQEDFEGALHHFDRQLLISRRLNIARFVTFALVNKAQALRNLDRGHEAKTCLLEALDIEGEGDPLLIMGLHLELGDLALHGGDYAEAQTHLEQVDPQNEKMMVDLRWRGALAKARLSASLGESRASTAFEIGINLLEKARQTLSEELRLKFLDASRALWDGWIEALAQKDDPKELVQALERSSARTFMDGLLAQNAPKNTTTQLGDKSPWAPVHGSQLPWQALPDDVAILQSYSLPDRLLLLWIHHGEIHLHQSDVGRDALQRSISELHSLCSTPSTPMAAINPALRLLSHWILKPLQAHIQTLKAETPIAFIPHGALNRLPLHALLMADEQPLILKHPVSYSPNLGAISHWQKTPKREGGSPLIMADAKGDLFHAREEAQGVQSLLGRGVVMTGANASFNSLSALGPQADIIHLAVHAKRNGANNGSILELAPGAHDAGEVDASHLHALNLHANLVVLSACYSGGGTLSKSGEGPDLLVWSFLKAGARQVIGSHWKVHDATSLQLMQAFYRNLQGGETPALALAHAQRALYTQGTAHTGGKERGAYLLTQEPISALNHPYYWAGYFLTGALG